MRRITSFIVVLLLVFSLTVTGQTIQAKEFSDSATSSAYVEGEVLVTLASPNKTGLAKEGTTSFDEDIKVEKTWDFGEADCIAETSSEEALLEDKNLYISEVHSDSYSTQELVDQLKDDKNVLSVEPNYYRYKMNTSTDTYRAEQWYLDGGGSYQGTTTGIHYDSLQQPSNQENVVVAVVDTGIDYTHEDLAEHMWVNPYPASSVSGTYGYDFGDNDSDPMDEDEDGHGTHCAGVISAMSDNQTGICGISKAKLMALKIFDSRDETSDSSIIAAFNYIYRAQSLGTNIAAINCSWGGGGTTSTTIKSLIEKIGSKGGLFIFAAGNDNINHDLSSNSKTCPYDIQSEYVVTVGASDPNDKKASFSDYGKKSVDLFAPGDRIFSTVNTNIFNPFTWDEQKRVKQCEFFSSLDTTDTELYTPAEVGKGSTSVSYLGKSYSSHDYYNNAESGSLSVIISSFRKSATLELYLDVTSLQLNKSTPYYLSYELGFSEDSSIYWEHHQATSKSTSFVTRGENTYLRLVGLTGNFNSISQLYIDNIAVSKANVDKNSFGKYDTLSGTSMAAPQVSAATALLAAIYPDDNAGERRNRLLRSTRQVEALSPYCVTSGLLDLSKIPTTSKTDNSTVQNEMPTADSTTAPTPKTTSEKVLVKKVKLNKKKATLRYGKKLKLKATVTPENATNKTVKWSVSNTKYAKVTQKGVVKVKKKGIGHTVKVYAKAKDKSGKKAYCKVKLKKKK